MREEMRQKGKLSLMRGEERGIRESPSMISVP
jgi:hypothetical protein